MSAIGSDAGTTVRDGVRGVATAMLPQLPALGAGTAEHIGTRVPEVAQAHAGELVLASCQANSNALLDALVRGVPLAAMSPSAEVMQTTRGLVQHGLTLPVVMRAYRIGIAYWCERWADAVVQHGPQGPGAVAVVSSGTSFLLGWLDLVADQLSEEYRDEAERLAREGSLARLEAVRRVLGGTDVDVPATSLRLGYDLAGRHLALVLHQQEEAAAGDAVLDAAARALAEAITTARPLIVRVDVVTTWCWVPLGEAAPPRLPAPRGPVLAGHGR
ncbi:MAG: Fis family transcriptional regulator, partial [Solirubrobacterales bacterium]|nr:Fis family transcriptional regulator [Solirubrobacterales bacterium]